MASIVATTHSLHTADVPTKEASKVKPMPEEQTHTHTVLAQSMNERAVVKWCKLCVPCQMINGRVVRCTEHKFIQLTIEHLARERVGGKFN